MRPLKSFHSSIVPFALKNIYESRPIDLVLVFRKLLDLSKERFS